MGLLKNTKVSEDMWRFLQFEVVFAREHEHNWLSLGSQIRCKDPDSHSADSAQHYAMN